MFSRWTGLIFLSLAVTAVVSYLVLFLLTKLVVGNKQISQMTMFDYISGISVGSIAAEMATEPESPLRPLTGMVVYGLLAWGVALWTNKSLAARRAFTGKPLILYDGGTLYREHLKRAKLDLSEFLTLCRAGGWFDLSQLETVVFEHNGNLSFLPREAYRAAQPTDLSLSPKQSVLMTPVIWTARCCRRICGPSARTRSGSRGKAARAGLFLFWGGLPALLRRKRRGPAALSDRRRRKRQGKTAITTGGAPGGAPSGLVLVFKFEVVEADDHRPECPSPQGGQRGRSRSILSKYIRLS